MHALPFVVASRLSRTIRSLRRNHQQDLTLAKTPPATEFSAGYRSLFHELVDRSRVDLQQMRHLGRGKNFLHRTFPPFIPRGCPHFLNWREGCQQISDSASKEKPLMPTAAENF
jgi:hypothetical protein